MTDNTITWLLIADSSRARLFTLHKPKFFQHPSHDNLSLLHTFNHEDSRKRAGELVVGKPGKFGKGTFDGNNTPHEHEAARFAHELATALHTGFDKHDFRDVILVAPPYFMGVLKETLPEQVRRHVSQTIEKDYTQLSTQELAARLSEHF